MTDATTVSRKLAGFTRETTQKFMEIRRAPYFPYMADERAASYFLLNEQSGDGHEGISGNTGTVTGATWGCDEAGDFLRFNGSSDYVSWGTSADYHREGASTDNMVSWDIICKPEPNGSDMVIIDKSDGVMSGADDIVNIRINSTGNVVAQGNNGSVWTLTSSIEVVSGQLTHIRMTYNTSATPKQALFVNDMVNAEDTDNVGSGNINNTTGEDFQFGRDGASTNYFKGKIYQVVISEQVRYGQILPL